MRSRIHGTEERVPRGPQPTLTARERFILNALWSGMDSNQIAEQLGLSVETVKTVRQRLRQKYQVSNVAQLMRAALAHGDLDV